ncbi:MAG TPA: hypothetical protein PLT30_14805 [Deltaproteobacteria bacterium]|nr:hypothetical protein [Deltaproteobacteria bacterium]
MPEREERVRSGYGNIFKSTTKKEAHHPDYRGSISINRETIEKLMEDATGEFIEVELSGWRKTDKNGHAFISVGIGDLMERVRARYQAARKRRTARRGGEE